MKMTKLQEEVNLIKASDLFDSSWYIREYPDVVSVGLDPVEHYLRFGAKLLRNPSASFDTGYYLLSNPDVENSGTNPLLHYLVNGRNEGRSPIPSSNHHRGSNCHKVESSLILANSNIDTKPVPTIEAPLHTTGVLGSVEKVSKVILSGWAIDKGNKAAQVILDLYVDNVFFSSTHTSIQRPDVKKVHGGTGHSGFLFELPPNLENDVPVALEVRARINPQQIKNSLHMMKPVPNARRAPSLAHSIYFGSPIMGQPMSSDVLPRVRIAIIVLNLNGEQLLRAFLRSFATYNSYENLEILIVDHNSKDDSRKTVAEFSDRLPVRLLVREDNRSFSDSNNWAAEQTEAEILIFANNDIEFCQDIIPRIREILSDPEIGIVGIKLLDKSLGRQSVTSVAVQHLGVYYRCDARERVVMPFETRPLVQFREVLNTIAEVPTVTGALMACRKGDFAKLGGFDTQYFYGYEDVDLCLRTIAVLNKRIVCANYLSAVHHRGVTRKDPNLNVGPRLKANWGVLERKLGFWLRRRMATELFKRPGYWTSLLPKIGFAVTDARDDAAAGDYFTALELARELQQLAPCKIIFLDKERKNWFDAAGLDVLVVMRDDYDLRNLQNPSPRLITVGWARNWIDRWVERPWAQDYSAYWASSKAAGEYLSKRLARQVEIVPIATNYAEFSKGQPDSALQCDYCFTGSYWGAAREIADVLDPSRLPYKFSVYGYGWDKHPVLSKYHRGGLPYSRMKHVYASTKIVIDDANTATKKWGSVNSRVFDALAAGALVITNGKVGADAIFDGVLPTYESRDQLETILTKYLSDEKSRLDLVDKLRGIVRKSHTYAERALVVRGNLFRLTKTQYRIAIKIAAPSQAVCQEWGDYHFASGIRRALTRKGHAVRIDCLDKWSCPETLGDDVVIVLRGLSKYIPSSHQINLMWNISHPDKIGDEEYETYDHVFVASEHHAKQLSARLNVPVTTLLQCTDPELFHPDVELCQSHDVLFVGNSRKIFRQIVKDAVTAGLPLSVFGTHWEKYLPPEVVKGTHISNDKLAGYYAAAGVVLNDHWHSMREFGFFSNRLFDAAACGSRIVSDRIDGLNAIFMGLVATYESPNELKDIVSQVLKEPEIRKSQRRELASDIAKNHSFDSRVRTILSEIECVATLKERNPTTTGYRS